jgi:hypothetical protein
VQRNAVVYPQSWLGAVSLVTSPSASMPASVALGVATKDFYEAGMGNPSLEYNCYGKSPVSMPQAMAQTIARIRDMGARYVAASSFARLNDVSAPTPTFDPAEQVTGSDLSSIAQQAHAVGLTFTFYLQVSSADDRNVSLSSSPTAAWFSAFMDAYVQRLYGFAAQAQSAGVDQLGLNWLEYFVDFANRPDLDDIFNQKMTAALAGVRSRYAGKVTLIDGQWSAVRPSGTALYGSVDAFHWGPPAAILTPCEDGNTAACPGSSPPTVALVKSKYANALSYMSARLAPFGKPITVAPMIQSHRYFFETGWIEDTPGVSCLSGCMQQSLATDFAIQTMGYEALLEAVVDRVHAGTNIAAVESPNYWYTDQMQPQTVFPNIAQTVRNKPAEMLLYLWFLH